MMGGMRGSKFSGTHAKSVRTIEGSILSVIGYTSIVASRQGGFAVPRHVGMQVVCQFILSCYVLGIKTD